MLSVGCVLHNWLGNFCVGVILSGGTTTHYPLPTTHYPLPTTHYPLPNNQELGGRSSEGGSRREDLGLFAVAGRLPLLGVLRLVWAAESWLRRNSDFAFFSLAI